MHQAGHTHEKGYSKSARSVGEVMGKFHPHGDQALYDTMVRMAQDFSLRYPLVDGQGNFGSIDGDPPAAMRYTESRLDRLSRHMLEDINKDTIDMEPNFDDTEMSLQFFLQDCRIYYSMEVMGLLSAWQQRFPLTISMKLLLQSDFMSRGLLSRTARLG